MEASDSASPCHARNWVMARKMTMKLNITVQRSRAVRASRTYRI